MNLLELWAAHHKGLVIFLDLLGVAAGFICLFALFLGFVKWSLAFFRPELSRSITEKVEQFKGQREAKRIRSLLLKIVRARRIHEDVRVLVCNWGLLTVGLMLAFAYGSLSIVLLLGYELKHPGTKIPLLFRDVLQLQGCWVVT